MPILVSPAATLLEGPTACNYPHAEANLMNEEELQDASDIIQAVKNYETFIYEHLPDHTDEMIFYSNFRRKDLEELLKDNQDCGFIRIYHGRKTDGSQLTIAVPVEGDNNGTTRQTANVKYYVNCCACRPNCGNNLGF